MTICSIFLKQFYWYIIEFYFVCKLLVDNCKGKIVLVVHVQILFPIDLQLLQKCLLIYASIISNYDVDFCIDIFVCMSLLILFFGPYGLSFGQHTRGFFNCIVMI